MRRTPHFRPRGVALVYATIALSVIMAFSTFAVDLGRVRLAKVELQDAVDSAVRYAATGLSDNTYLAKAQASASQNIIDGTALALTAADVEIGSWNTTTKVFTPGGTPTTAIRITGWRSAARGTQVPMMVGRAIGMNGLDVSARATATASSNASYDVVGLNGVTLSGATTIRRLNTEGGTVNVATNTTAAVPNSCFINGDVYYRTTAPSEPGGGITGTTNLMSSDISYAAPSVPGGATNLGAVNMGWQGGTVTAGNYTCTTLTLGGGGTFNVVGDVNVYASGNVSLANGCVINTNNGANKLTIYMTGTNTANVNMSSTFYARIYGPSATLNLAGASPMVGSCVVRNLNISGSATLSYTSTLPSPISPTGGGGGGGTATIATVR